MIGQINHINVGPRMDGGPFEAEPEAKIVYDKANDIYVMEILDKKNPEFQARVMFSQEDLDTARNDAEKQ